ncbi:MAG: hypothetical protein ABMA13_22380 [Chthoniobacteraceae bacterium]
MGRPFRYALDPLCLASCALYAANRWLVKPHVASDFLRGHFNDLLLIPCALPLVLWAQRRLGLRGHDEAPAAGEVALHLVVWTLIAECIGPRWLHRGVADPWDAAAYALGATLALVVWGRSACAVSSR